MTIEDKRANQNRIILLTLMAPLLVLWTGSWGANASMGWHHWVWVNAQWWIFWAGCEWVGLDYLLEKEKKEEEVRKERVGNILRNIQINLNSAEDYGETVKKKGTLWMRYLRRITKEKYDSSEDKV